MVARTVTGLLHRLDNYHPNCQSDHDADHHYLGGLLG